MSRKSDELMNEKIHNLRKATFTSNGTDKDITLGISSNFLKFDCCGLNLNIEFSSKLTKLDLDSAFGLVKYSMEEVYDASGYGWDDDDKMKEMTEEGVRFLLVKDNRSNSSGDPHRLVAFVHFRFSIQGEVMDQFLGDTALYVWDIHVDEKYQKKGLGKHLLTLLELIARREKMKMISIPVQLNDHSSIKWISRVGKGYAPDTSLLQLVGFNSGMEGFEVYSKSLEPTFKRVDTLLPDRIPAPISRVNFRNSDSNIEKKINRKSIPHSDTSSPSSVSSLDNYEYQKPQKLRPKQLNTSPSFETWQTLTWTPPSSPCHRPPTLPSHEEDEWLIIKKESVEKDITEKNIVIKEEIKTDFISESFVMIDEKTDEFKDDSTGNNVPNVSICPMLPVSFNAVTSVAGLISKIGVMYTE